MHKLLRLTAWASPRAFARKARPDGHAVKQVLCENLCMGAYLTIDIMLWNGNCISLLPKALSGVAQSTVRSICFGELNDELQKAS